MANKWVEKLRRYTELRADDEDLLLRLSAQPRHFDRRTDIISHGEKPSDIHVMLSGLACRYKVLPDGRRQIMAYLLPGDICDLYVFLLDEMDHGIGTLGPSEVAFVPKAEVLRIIEERPRLTQALWWSSLVDEAVLREWIVNMGQRGAYERIAHLMWELYLRHKAVGLIADEKFELPLSQQDIADTMGLSLAHVNKSLQRLRAEGVLEFREQTLSILKAQALREVSDFDPDYLHQGG